MKITTTILLCLIVIFLVSCDKGQENDVTSGETVIVTSHFETYTYMSELAEIQNVSGIIPKMWTQDEQIYYCYKDYDPTNEGIFVISHTIDGQDVRKTKVTDDVGFMVHCFSVSEDDIFVMLLSKQQISSANNEFSLIYYRFDSNGNELSRIDITEIFPHLTSIHDIIQAVFIDEDNIAITMRDIRGTKSFIIDTTSGTTNEIQLGIVIDSSSFIYTVSSNAPYDVLISNRDYLYGYVTETNTQTLLLNWAEVGIDHSQVVHIGLTDDGRVLVLTQTGNFMTTQTQLYILTPILRVEVQDKITITLGGLYISDAMLSAVAKYNLENINYHIEVINYLNIAGGDYQTGRTRLLTELIAGSGPDILLSSGDGTFAARAPLLDLYTFIDADPELSRSDFFTNILQGLEKADGTLPMLTQSFAIQTMIGTPQALGHIENWTFSAFFALGEENRHVPNQFGGNQSKQQFLSYMMLYSYGEFIDMDTYTANFDSESFIKLLDTAAFFNETIDPNLRPNPFNKYIKILGGAQILAFDTLHSVSYFHTISQIMGDSFFAIGFPTSDGGKHIALTDGLFGINATSLHADAAWGFIRTLLLESEDTPFICFPLRIDFFNAMVDNAIAPAYKKDISGNYLYDSNGDLIYTFHNQFIAPNGNRFAIYEMTEVAESELRRVINSARVSHFLTTVELWHIIYEELENFTSGIRSAETIARSLQFKVEMYLSEQMR
ncbi:MAG: hypothetical protein LBC73_00940 [Oscillospiraceae bacterium]|jgi:hypothetical protein|nr:hypothetical protein [Oscillospiraceae bacterium]